MKAKAKKPESTLVLRHWIDAPSDRVFKAWTDPNEMRQWYSASSDHVIHSVEVDLRVGGGYRAVFGPPGEEPIVETGEYREIVPGKRLVFMMTLARGGEVISSGSLISVEFIERGRKTEVVLSDTGPDAASHEQGWRPALENLSRALG
jgi:uncharacterized protein YndB with AHSA1/START domain